jgi:2'-5' RNA ligase
MTGRIFIALDISVEAAETIARFTGELRDEFPHIRVGWEKPEKVHLTLKFLGDIEEDELAKVKEAVLAAAGGSSPFALRIEKTGCFPSPAKARILWLGLTDESGALRKLQAELEKAFEAWGFGKEKREFKAHLTLARLREPQKARELVKAFLQKKFEPVSFEVSEIVIYESRLQPTGSVYSVIQKQKLK